jgi:hypothetical protein
MQKIPELKIEALDRSRFRRSYVPFARHTTQWKTESEHLYFSSRSNALSLSFDCLTTNEIIFPTHIPVLSYSGLYHSVAGGWMPDSVKEHTALSSGQKSEGEVITLVFFRSTGSHRHMSKCQQPAVRRATTVRNSYCK